MKTSMLLAFCVACAIANADNSACANKDFRGIYVFHAHAVSVVNNAALTFAGSLTADGQGKITAWKDVAATAAVTPAPPNFKLVTPVLDRYEEARRLGSDILYTVEPDCRITVTGQFLGPTGSPSPVVWVGGLGAGGKEALVMNASPQSPYVSLVTLKRASRNAGRQE